jgi:hypothetical protein
MSRPALYRCTHHVPVIEPWRVPLTTNGAGEFQRPARKPAPPSQHFRLVRCCVFGSDNINLARGNKTASGRSHIKALF